MNQGFLLWRRLYEIGIYRFPSPGIPFVTVGEKGED